ncbi:4-hydroxy-tetrahydrodipicolinate reductase [Virgibacillus phasianinus]|uniref:4-hydroxy-tetrahydrodipicolinate reductase n=1 Tax=Virgibacillus phasianinus TaxID=2017483 RepID=A0A220U6P6_9BACI|nr:4-hydroxy-tetrahydrodipicolinate reductase [Virgibacillus phasianinus]ASK63799.1 4-hydroxy-tetrahydrodipicolinate reductase [Virgibacillus phasianinus]
MKILLLGYGAMNKRVARLAEERGHELAGVALKKEKGDVPYPIFTDFNKLPDADVLIDFSHPDLTKHLLEADVNLPLVIATTGEKEVIVNMMEEKSRYLPTFYSANMSYGVHILKQIVEFATPLLNSYDIELTERHHNKKVDAPSGTLVKLYDAIKGIRENAEPMYNRHTYDEKRKENEIGIHSLRGGTIVGEHEALYAGHDEVITIQHKAQSKDIFANGAIDVAEKLINKEHGFYTYTNLGDE